MDYEYDEKGKLVCGSCHSRVFDLVAEMRITDVSKDEDDPIGNRTIESESVISLICARCGRRINNSEQTNILRK